MKTHSVVVIYDGVVRATQAVRALDRDAFPMGQVSMISQTFRSPREIHGYITAGGVEGNDPAISHWSSGVFKTLTGAAFLWTPSEGAIVAAGSAAAALLDALKNEGAGVSQDGLLAALLGWAVPQERFPYYERLLKDGRHLLVVRGGPAEVARASALLRGTPLDEIFTYSDINPQESPTTDPMPTPAAG